MALEVDDDLNRLAGQVPDRWRFLAGAKGWASDFLVLTLELRRLNIEDAVTAQTEQMKNMVASVGLGTMGMLAGCGYPVDPDKFVPDFGIRGDHGAIAVNESDFVGALTARYLNQDEADNRALQLCGKGCAVVLRFEGAGVCGVLAASSNKHFGVGRGATLSEATKSAVEQCTAKGGDECVAKLQGCND